MALPKWVAWQPILFYKIFKMTQNTIGPLTKAKAMHFSFEIAFYILKQDGKQGIQTSVPILLSK